MLFQPFTELTVIMLLLG